MISVRNYIAAWLIAFLILGSSRVSWGSEPIYGGKPLKAWLADLGSNNPEEIRDQARDAVRQIGTNALPFLLKELNTFERTDVAYLYTTEGEHRRSVINSAFQTLGLTAKPAIPALVDCMNHGGNASCIAVRSLTKIGTNGVLPLTQALTNGTLAIRICIASIINEAGTNAVIAVPSLLQCLKNQSPDKDKSAALRTFSASALGAIDSDSEIIVPALIERLQDENSAVRFNAIRALRRLGKKARTAASALRAALDDSDYHVRDEAALALKQIESPSP